VSGLSIPRRLGLALIVLASCSGPGTPPPEPTIPSSTPTPAPPPEPTPGSALQLPRVIDDDLVRIEPESLGPLDEDLERTSLVEVLGTTIEALAARPAAETIRFGDGTCPRAALTAAYTDLRARAIRGEHLAPVLRERFRFYRSRGRADGLLVTGYYEPVLEARRRRAPGFDVPIYRRPGDLVEVPLADFVADAAGRKIFGRLENEHLAPYLTRREIDGRRKLAGRNLELAWLKDRVDVFFLHIQGSGLLRFPDGTAQRVGFAASNGRPYTSIGRVLLDEGALASGEATAQGIQNWLHRHPKRATDVMYRNERYIFFRPVDAAAPIGALGAPLTAGRSVAADPTRYPLATLAWLETASPLVTGDGRFAGALPARRLVVVQDTGAAITGPGRLDLYFGTGALAGKQAGVMSAGGALTALFPDCPR
jgi:membrane-bound lytic murein transglycosylase A